MTTTSWAVIVAGGKDEMLNPEVCTAFLNLQNKPVLSYSLSAFEHCHEIDGIVVVAPRERLEQVASVVLLFGCHKVKKIVPGGASQFASLVNGIKYVDDNAGIILMHEAARPNLKAADISELIKVTKRNDYAMLGRIIEEETATVSGKTAVVDKFLDGGSIWTFGTPAAVTSDLWKKSLAAIRKKNKTVKTMAEAVALTGVKPKLVQAHSNLARISSFEQLQQMEHVPIAM